MIKSVDNETEAQDARSRLVIAALRFFAEKGFEAATTREICIAADVNISAIRYYFGDKAGLYRVTFNEPMGKQRCQTNSEAYTSLPIAEALGMLFKDFLEPLKNGDESRLVMKLHFREMIEPTGVWQHEIDAEIKPQHTALVTMLQHYLGLQRIDEDIHRLAFAIIGMAVHYYVGQDVVASIYPQLLDNPKAIDVLAERLAGYAVSMIAGEAHRRQQLADHEQ